jgi:hypothetical protein
MKYILLIYAAKSDQANVDPKEQAAYMQRYFTFTKDLVKSGKMVAGDPLQGVAAATSVKVRNGKTLTTDGSFAETKEQLGGYYIVDADDLDDAIAWAAKLPTAEHGTIEVRPLMNLPDM